MSDIGENFYEIHLNHCGGKKYTLNFPKDTKSEDLINKIEEQLEIPRYQLKVIFNGKQIYDEPTTFESLRIPQKGGKFMAVGKRNSPEEEAVMIKMTDILKSANKYENEVQEKLIQYDNSIRKDFIKEKDNQKKIIEDMRKRTKFLAEQQLKFLMELDMISLKSEFMDAKRMRKNCVSKIQMWLDETDKFIGVLDGLDI